MEKNVIVTDEDGKIFGETYIKRAKGLVKNGRARYTDESRTKICLINTMRAKDGSPVRYDFNDILTKGTNTMTDIINNIEENENINPENDTENELMKLEAAAENTDASNAEKLKYKAATELLELVKKGIVELVYDDFESRALDTLSNAAMVESEQTAEALIATVGDLVAERSTADSNKIVFLRDLLDRLGIEKNNSEEIELELMKRKQEAEFELIKVKLQAAKEFMN